MYHFIIPVEFEEDEARLEGSNMASVCNSQEAVVDSGVDSEATTPSSPEDDPQEEDGKSKDQLSDEMVLETAETLLALSGKKTNQNHTAIVIPQNPDSDVKGKIKLIFSARVLRSKTRRFTRSNALIEFLFRFREEVL